MSHQNAGLTSYLLGDLTSAQAVLFSMNLPANRDCKKGTLLLQQLGVVVRAPSRVYAERKLSVCAWV